ncbi:dTMP kinase [Hydrogenispora ethanolica]|uniref:Thymidylate kinase n=1 Tax=Hydrogenispora ethanolica TaxID=1082276 RepID=A0A4R1SA85_HYDET|nr:dTMP kinase [Hydrogenispora ethanolica]TCL76361.1 dTMP kinase [Hydrogenispora ethanolica]
MIITIEGLDGAGKSVQINLLKDYLRSKSIQFKYVHFPRIDSPVYGELIASFLRGELGELDPKLIALLYAGDRDNAKTMLLEWIKQGYLVILDRYVYSNIAFQCAKLRDELEKQNLKEWIQNLEYNYNKIPKPDLSLFLHVPFEFVENQLRKSRQGKDREYLNGKEDIHEVNLNLQKQVEKEYVKLTQENEDFLLIKCSNDMNEMLLPAHIHGKLIEVLQAKGVIE